MNKNEQISAMLDGELDRSELNLLFESLDEDAIQLWESFSAVGDLIRSSEAVAFHSPDLLKQIEASLEAEPVVIAPALAVKLAHQKAEQMPQGLFTFIQPRRFLAAAAAVGFFSFALNQAVPPIESQVQMVRTEAVDVPLSDEELALWQEYFQAHQQNSVRGGLSGVSPIARVEADRPDLNKTNQTIYLDLAF